MLSASCGGGGGGGGDGDDENNPGPYTISGTASYDAVPVQADGVGLDYDQIARKPIRGATIELLDAAGNALATAVTGADGTYSVTLPTSQPVTVRVRAELRRGGAADGEAVFTVRDNTDEEALYTLASESVTPTDDTTVDLRAASGWGGSAYTATRAAAPFAILDVAYAAQAKVATAAPDAALSAVKLFWSPQNAPSDVDVDYSQGLIGTSSYVGGDDPAVYILGADGIDTDEYDVHVVAHELGHYLQDAVSRDDSIGGGHSAGQKLDMRVAFSEGFGNAWSGMALSDPRYADSLDEGQQGGFTFSVADAPVATTSTSPGWYAEDTVQYLLWRAHESDAIGFAPIYESLLSLREAPTFTSIFSFTEALRLAVPGEATKIDAFWASQGVTGDDAFGINEANNGGQNSNLPIYKTYGVPIGTSQTFCLNGDNGEYNKLGNAVFVRLPIAAAGDYTVTAERLNSSGSTTDPDIALVLADGSVQRAQSETANVETLATTLSAGTHVLALTDFLLVENGSSCFDLKVD